MKKIVNIVIFGLLLVIFGSYMFTYQVRSNEIVLVNSWSGKPQIKYGSTTIMSKEAVDARQKNGQPDSDAGIQFKLPWPLQKIYKLDGRIHVTETGFDEELGAGGETLLISVYAGWHVSNAEKFRQQFGRFRSAKEMMGRAKVELGTILKTARNEVLGSTEIFMSSEQVEFRKEEQAALSYVDAEKKIMEKVAPKA